jgi:hypothetical protein
MIHAASHLGVGFVLRDEEDPMNQPASCLGKTWEPRVDYLQFSMAAMDDFVQLIARPSKPNK